MIKAAVLGSGSKGNSVWVEVNGQAMLLDNGFSYKELSKRLIAINRRPSQISKIYISHPHLDHQGGCKSFFGKHPETIVYRDGKGKNDYITPFKLDHDVDCYGFAINDGEGNKLVYSPDSVSIPCDSLHHYIDATAIIVEANHDISLLIDSSYNDDLKLRINSTHMENSKCGDLLSLIAWKGLSRVVLFHLSENANQPLLAEYEARRGLTEAGFSDVAITVASQKEPTELFIMI